MAALRNMAGHYIFALWFLLSSIFYFLSSIFFYLLPRRNSLKISNISRTAERICASHTEDVDINRTQAAERAVKCRFFVLGDLDL